MVIEYFSGKEKKSVLVSKDIIFVTSCKFNVKQKRPNSKVEKLEIKYQVFLLPY